MNRIQKLDPLLINQIAAGEVIERPASVLKEVLENAVDAGSSKISVKLLSGGKQLLEVTDNGDGIFREELKMAIEPHATSKIASLVDLHQIASLGFRGEALASIASVSKFDLVSKPKQQDQAYRVHVEGKDSEIKEDPDAHPKGTTIRVKDLFFNVPVRKKFLKQDKTEYLYCEEVFKRIALAHPQTAFELKSEQETKLYYPAHFGDQAYRLRAEKLLGKRFIDNASDVEINEHDIHIYGLVAKPEYSRSQTDQQYVFLNGRYIKDKLISHALRQAYEDQIDVGRYPAYVLFIEMDPEAVDVNVHPQKTEVRFQSPRVIHDLLVARLRALWNGEITTITAPVVLPKPSQMSFSEWGASEKETSSELTLPDHKVFVSDDKMYIIDLKRFYGSYYESQLMSQQKFEANHLLFPARCTVNAALLDKLTLIIEKHMHPFCIELDRVGRQDLLLRSLPKLDFEVDENIFLSQLIESCEKDQLSENKIKKLLIQSIRITEQMKQDKSLYQCIEQNNKLPFITIDLKKFEVVS